MAIISYGRQNITEEDIQAVCEVLRSDYLTQGPKVAEFEEAFSKYVNARFAVAVSNGTAALHLGAIALNVDERSNVITTPITFAASANGIRYCGGNIHFADIDSATFLIDLNKVEDLIKSRPDGFFHGIIPVDFAGQSVPVEDLNFLANRYHLWIMEDACHALGGYFLDTSKTVHRIGSSFFSDLTVFSFHPVKHIATGEGGMITTNNRKIYERLLSLRTHGVTRDPDKMKENHGGWYYEMQELGYNYRLTDLQSALGISQLKRIDQNINRRIEIADRYFRELSGIPELKVHPVKDGHAYHLYVILTPKRDDLYAYLREKGIYCQVHYIPVHTMPYYQLLGFRKGDFPNAEKYYEQCLSIPMYHSLTDADQSRVIESIKTFFQ